MPQLFCLLSSIAQPSRRASALPAATPFTASVSPVQASSATNIEECEDFDIPPEYMALSKEFDRRRQLSISLAPVHIPTFLDNARRNGKQGLAQPSQQRDELPSASATSSSVQM